jgi:hypothetical protein
VLLKPATNGTVTGTGSIILESRILGGVLITTDGTNAAVVTVQKDNASGRQIFSISTKTPIFIMGPMGNRDTDNSASQIAYYSVTGTGAAAQLYEWVE